MAGGSEYSCFSVHVLTALVVYLTVQITLKKGCLISKLMIMIAHDSISS